MGRPNGIFYYKKLTSAAKCGFCRSKLRIGSQIATGNLSACPLDGDFAPHARIICITDAVSSLRSQQSARRSDSGGVTDEKE